MIHAVVVDASVVVTALVEGRNLIAQQENTMLLAPSVLPYEVANVLRKLWAGRGVTEGLERNAVRLLRRFPVVYWQWEPIAERVWELRYNLTSTDASYVAVAEMASATLITKDRKNAAAPGIRCAVEVLP